MTLRVTAAELDCMVLASERPTPIPLPLGAGLVPVNPMTFPVDWGFGCRLTTRWLTDVTRSLDRRPEKWVLSSRPARSLEVTVIGASREESASMQMSCLSMASRIGNPVPIYPDMAEISSLSQTGASCTVFGDFRYRRFFVGGRVCFMSVSVSPAQQDNSTIFGTVVELAPGYLKVDLVAEAMRSVTVSDVVFPCMDVELVEKSSGLGITDSVYQLTLSWNELEGESALPPSWPSVSAADADVASPLCPVVDGLPVFPFNPDWTNGVEISIERETSSDKAGRTAVQEPKGRPYHRFNLNVMGYDRASCWRVGRFFDAVRGRGASFYFHHPQAPWTLYALPTLSQASIRAVGSLSSIGFYTRAAFFRADGSFVVKEISGATQLSGIFVLQLSSPLPDSSFVSAQPIFVCSFDQDALEESWSTSAVVPAFSLAILEEPSYGTVNVASLGYPSQTPSIQGIPGIDLLFRAGSGCLSPAGQPSTIWSGSDDRVEVMTNLAASDRRSVSGFAVSKDLQRVPPAPGPLTPAYKSRLARFPIPYENNGQPAVLGAYYDLPYMVSSAVPVAQRHLWSDSGWTLCLVWTPAARSGFASTQRLFQVTSPEVVMQMNYDTSGFTGPARSRFIVNGTHYPLTVDLEDSSDTVRVLTIHVSSGLLRIWVNGVAAISAATSLSLPLPSSYSISRWFEFIDTVSLATLTSANLRTYWGVKPALDLMTSFNRGLSAEELNTLHSIISDVYLTPNYPVVLF